MMAMSANTEHQTTPPAKTTRRFDLQHLAFSTTATNEAAEPAVATKIRRIVDARGEVFCRELIFSEFSTADAGKRSASLADQLRELSIVAVGSAHKTFIRATPELLRSPGIDWLPASALVLILDFPDALDGPLLTRCRQLHERGFALALAGYAGLDARARPLLSMLDFIEISFHESESGNDGAKAAAALEYAASLSSLPIKLLASGINRCEQLPACRQAGFHLFQGDAVARPDEVITNYLPVSRAGLVRLLAQLVHRASWETIEDACRKEPSLAINLLQLAQFAAHKPASTALTLRRALAVIGEQSLKCWLELQLQALDSDAADNAQFHHHMRLAALGGRLLEDLMRKLEPGNGERAAAAYLAGSLSIMQKAAQQTMGDFLRRLPLEPDVSWALLEREGLLGQCLDILEHFDRRDALACDRQLRQTSGDRLSYADLQICFAEALAWLTATDES